METYSRHDIAVVIKRHTHDVRNALNGMEIELTLLEEGSKDAAMREAVKRLREAGNEINRLMRGLSSKYELDSPSVIPALQIAEQWNWDARQVASGVPVHWTIELGSHAVCVEAALVRAVLRDALELAVRIARKNPLQIRCFCNDGRAVFRITAEDGNTNAAVIGSQQAYWSALRGLAKRNHILMLPECLSPDGCFPIQVSLPLHQPETSS